MYDLDYVIGSGYIRPPYAVEGFLFTFYISFSLK